MEQMDESLIEKDFDIINKEYYEGIKGMIYCSICLDIVDDPVQCDKCQHCFCSQCTEQLKECPFRCQNSNFIPSIICKQLLSELKIKCKCGKDLNYDLLEKHKIEDCIKTDFKKKFIELKKEYELLKQEMKKKYEPKDQNYIKSNLHHHPIECIRKFLQPWQCDNCERIFTEDTPSYKCTLCDYDLCYNCAKNSITKGAVIDKMMDYYNSGPWNISHSQIRSSTHQHPLECSRRFLQMWKCNNCKQTFNDIAPLYQCTLCKYDLCYFCAKSTLTQGAVIDKMIEFYDNNNNSRNSYQFNNRPIFLRNNSSRLQYAYYL